jgi:hypothetical protein
VEVNLYIYILTCVVDLSLDMSCLYDSSKPSTEAIVIGQRCKRVDLAKVIRSQRHRYSSFYGNEVGYFGISLDAERCSDTLDILKSDEVQVSVAPSTFGNTTILVGLYTSNTCPLP